MTDLQRKNRRVMGITLGVVAGMVLLAYASVPLYTMLCKVTGWGGTTQDAPKNPGITADRVITVQFDASVAQNMPWKFRPDQREVRVKVGQDAIISYVAENPTASPVTGTAVYNVTPLKAGKYFYKTQCFCFDKQTLNAGQKTHMPVTFFIGPEIMDDPEMADVKTITLSYTFFQHKSPELEKAKQKFYQEQNDTNIN